MTALYRRCTGPGSVRVMPVVTSPGCSTKHMTPPPGRSRRCSSTVSMTCARHMARGRTSHQLAGAPTRIVLQCCHHMRVCCRKRIGGSTPGRRFVW